MATNENKKLIYKQNLKQTNYENKRYNTNISYQ